MKLIKHQNDYYLVKKEYHNGLQKSVITLSGREVIASTQTLEHLPLIKQSQIEDLLSRKANILALAELSKSEELRTLDYQDGLYDGFIKGYEYAEENNKNSKNLEQLIAFVKSIRDDWENVSEDVQKKAENLIFSITKEPEEWDVEVERYCEHCSDLANKEINEFCDGTKEAPCDSKPKVISNYINILNIK